MVRAVELAHAPYAAHLHTVSGEKHTRVPVLLAARVAHGVSCRVCCCASRVAVHASRDLGSCVKRRSLSVPGGVQLNTNT